MAADPGRGGWLPDNICISLALHTLAHDMSWGDSRHFAPALPTLRASSSSALKMPTRDSIRPCTEPALLRAWHCAPGRTLAPPLPAVPAHRHHQDRSRSPRTPAPGTATGCACLSARFSARRSKKCAAYDHMAIGHTRRCRGRVGERRRGAERRIQAADAGTQ